MRGQRSNPVIYGREMSSRAEKAMFKAEETVKKAEAEWSKAVEVEKEAWKIVDYFQKVWDTEHPEKKGYWFNDWHKGFIGVQIHVRNKEGSRSCRC